MRVMQQRNQPWVMAQIWGEPPWNLSRLVTGAAAQALVWHLLSRPRLPAKPAMSKVAPNQKCLFRMHRSQF